MGERIKINVYGVGDEYEYYGLYGRENEEIKLINNNKRDKNKQIDIENMSFDSKSKFKYYENDNNIHRNLLKEHKNGISTFLPQSNIIGSNSLYVSIELPPI